MSPFHWISAISTKPPSHKRKEMWSLLATGDFCPVMNNSSSGPSVMKRDSWIMPELSDIIKTADLAIINHEGSLSDQSSPVSKAGPSSSLDPSESGKLYSYGFNLATLANNHTMDFGFNGLNNTISQLQSENILVCGAGADRESALRPAFFYNQSGLKIAIIAVCENESGIAGEQLPGVAWISDPNIDNIIKTTRAQADVIVLVAHGGCEEVPFPPLQRCEQLRHFIDIGVDLVIGHHAHVPQGWESYKQGLIFYSLGDFYFRRKNEFLKPLRRWSYIIQVKFDGRRLLGADVIPIESLSDGSVDLIKSVSCRNRCLDYLNNISKVIINDNFTAYWQVTAKYLWKKIYWPYLRRSLHQLHIRPEWSFCKQDIFLFPYHFGIWLKKRLRPHLIDESASNYGHSLLLHLLRTESHRWAMETWPSLAAGDSDNVITSEIERSTIHYMNQMKTVWAA